MLDGDCRRAAGGSFILLQGEFSGSSLHGPFCRAARPRHAAQGLGAAVFEGLGLHPFTAPLGQGE